MDIYGWSTDSLIAANHIKVDDITTLSASTEVSYLRQWNFDAENPAKKKENPAKKKAPRMNLNRFHYDIYPEFYLKLSTLFPSSPTSSHHQSKWLESQFHMKKKKQHPVCLLMLLLILTIGHTPSHSTSKVPVHRVFFLPGNLPWKNSLSSKGHKKDMGKQVQRASMRIRTEILCNTCKTWDVL